jgi:RNA recognition motif-containing protein
VLGERGNPPIRVMGELYHEEDIVEEFDDALGNGERRIFDFVDKEALCMRIIYVGNVPMNISEAHVREYFETFGTLESVDMTSRRRLEMSFFRIVAQEASTVNKIQNSRPHFIEGKQVTTKRALLQKDKRVGYINTKLIYIGPPFSFSYKTMTAGLTNSVNEDDIHDFFAKFGHVTEVHNDDQNFGGAFVNFHDTDSADQVALLRGFMINGRTVEAEKVFNEDDKDEENAPDLNTTGDPEHKIMRKMIVFNLPDKCTTSDVKEYFSKFGEIEECFLPKSKGNGKLFSVIIYAKAKSVDDVLEQRPHTIEVGEVSRELAVKRPQPRGEDKDLANVDQIKFYAREPWDDIEEEEIEEYFKGFGEVETLRMLTKPPNRMGFIRFSDQDSARKASLLYLHKIKGRDVEVQKALDARIYKKKKEMAMMHDAMMQEEMMRRQMIMENMQMLRLRAQRDMSMSGLRGIGGDGGMGAEIPPMRQGGGFGNFHKQSPDCIILDNVPDDMHRRDLISHFSKFGRVKNIDYEKNSGTTYILFEEDYMTDYCSRKNDHIIGGVTMKIRKGKRPPRVVMLEEENEPSAGHKRTAQEMEEENGGAYQEDGEGGENPLLSDDY